MSEPINEASVTELGNPAKPTGEAGAQMLERMNESHAAVTAWGLTCLDLQAASRVLDIGCGGGACLQKMAQTVTAGHLTGVDYSAVSVAQSRALNAAAIAQGRMGIAEGSVEALPFADAAFDRIVTVESFYFWPNPQENLREVRRVLAPSGIFVLIADICDCDTLTEHERENIAKYNLYNPTPAQFHALLENAGFDPVQIHLRGEGKSWIAAEGRAKE